VLTEPWVVIGQVGMDGPEGDLVGADGTDDWFWHRGVTPAAGSRLERLIDRGGRVYDE